MGQIASSNWFGEIHDLYTEAINLLRILVQYVSDYFVPLPSFVKTTVFILLSFAVVGILLSHALGIYKNRREWKPKPDSNLMFSYFCGSGQFQRKKIYQDAYKLLYDRKWSWISLAGLAFRLGNYNHPSKILMFACSILYLPMSILGFIEMVFRVTIGTAWLICASFVHRIILLALRWISYGLIPLWQIADRSARVEQYCSHCYNKFNLPGFKCPSCGVIHKQLIPSRSGILIARCECGRFFSSSAHTGRSQMDAVCPKCDCDLAAANAKQFSIQLLGGNASGKTAFLAAFQHTYLDCNIGKNKVVLSGKPDVDFEKLEETYKNGITEPSPAKAVTTYNIIHRFGHNAKHNLVICDIPDEIIMSGVYERNPLNFGYTDGIIIVVDPLSVPSVRDECMKNGDNKALENYSKDSIETIIVLFINQFSEIVGRSARRMLNVPVSVVISKTDIKAVKREVGLPKIKAKFSASPELYQNSIETAQNEICRDYLIALGLANALNNLESVFSVVRYFSTSAIGHICETDKPFDPVGVIEPISWITKEKKASIYPILLDTQSIVSNENIQDESATQAMTERYQKAEELLAANQLDAATRAFVALGGYRDSVKRADEIKELRYRKAIEILSTKQYDEATKEFNALSNYKDSRKQVLKARYMKADLLLANAQYQEAVSLFRSLGNFQDAASRVSDARYQEASSLIVADDYISALAIFSELENYKDSMQKVSSLLPGLIRQGQTRGLSIGSYQWRVLIVEDKKALIITEDIIEERTYNETQEDVTWENCNLRHYLNNEFYNKFSKKERTMIEESHVHNQNSEQQGTNGGNDTIDNIFLLSLNEAKRYFSDNADGIAICTDKSEIAGWWWLRSPGGKSIYAAMVDNHGKISDGGNLVNNSAGGVRPAMWIKL